MGQGVFPKVPPRIGTVYYGGIDRMEWFDVDEDFYKGSLAPDIARMRKLVEEDNCDDTTGINLCKDLPTAVALLKYSNRESERNEIIVVRSPLLSEIRGDLDLDAPRVIWIGYDLVCHGFGSILCTGLFSQPAYFERWMKFLNSDGLFLPSVDVDKYVAEYNALSREDVVEDVPDDPLYQVDLIEIGRLPANGD